MNQHYYYGYPYRPYGAYHHPGLLSVFGGIMNLTIATLGGGARIIRTVVEGTVWHGCYDPGGWSYPVPYHYYQIQCCPPAYWSCC